LSIHLDDSRFPLVRFTWIGEPIVEDAADFNAKISSVFARKSTFVFVHDMTAGKQPGIKAINAFVDVSNRHKENDRRYAAGFAFVLRSAILRAGIKGFFALSPMVAPTLVTESLEVADTWARERLKEKGVLGA
jgi:hypothetical protein